MEDSPDRGNWFEGQQPDQAGGWASPLPPQQQQAPAPVSRRRPWAGVGLVAAGAVAGGILAGTLSASAATTSTTPASGYSSSASSSESGQPSGAAFPKHGTAAHEAMEKPVTGDNATKAQAAAEKAVGSGSKAGAVTTDASGSGYEVTVTKADGSSTEVHLDQSFAVHDHGRSGG